MQRWILVGGLVLLLLGLGLTVVSPVAGVLILFAGIVVITIGVVRSPGRTVMVQQAPPQVFSTPSPPPGFQGQAPVPPVNVQGPQVPPPPPQAMTSGSFGTGGPVKSNGGSYEYVTGASSGSAPSRRSEFTVFLEGITDKEAMFEHVFYEFGQRHSDSKVTVWKPFQNGYNIERHRFGIEQVPAFALQSGPVTTDEPLQLVFQRGFFTADYFNSEDGLVGLVSDFHNLCVDNLLAQARQKELNDKISRILKKSWDQLRGVVSISPG